MPPSNEKLIDNDRKVSALNDVDERCDLTVSECVTLVGAGGLNQILQAVRPAVYLTARYLDRPQILKDPYHRVQPVSGCCVLPANVLSFPVVAPFVAKHGHEQIVHYSFDLDHTAGRELYRIRPSIVDATVQKQKHPELRFRAPLTDGALEARSERVMDG